MKKSYLATIFIVLCLIVCAIPSVCMLFARSDETIGNEIEVKAPSFTKEDGSFNESVLGDAGDYFETHYAFRPAIITADAKIQANVFGVSNTDTVLVGTNGWLYYTSTLNDYIGKESLSERGMWNLAHNLKMIQDYVEYKGAKFLFTVPPNKNSLYGENMPYYEQESFSDVHNRDSLKNVLEAAGVNYVDLFEVFETQDDVLYLKEDSHWNNKGALLAFNKIMDASGKAHNDYSEVNVTEKNIHNGDLSEMIYPAAVTPEKDYEYDYTQEYNYIKQKNSMSDEISVEDFKIETVNENASNNLLMYRDSFSNTLIPLISNEFTSAYYSKSAPANFINDIMQRSPDYVIIEKVERNLSDFATNPGIIPAASSGLNENDLTEIKDAKTEIKACETDQNYVAVSGTVPENEVNSDDKIYLSVTYSDGHTCLYEAYTVTTDETDYGFLTYLPVGSFGTIEDVTEDMFKIYIENK